MLNHRHLTSTTKSQPSSSLTSRSQTHLTSSRLIPGSSENGENIPVTDGYPSSFGSQAPHSGITKFPLRRFALPSRQPDVKASTKEVSVTQNQRSSFQSAAQRRVDPSRQNQHHQHQHQQQQRIPLRSIQKTAGHSSSFTFSDGRSKSKIPGPGSLRSRPEFSTRVTSARSSTSSEYPAFGPAPPPRPRRPAATGQSNGRTVKSTIKSHLSHGEYILASAKSTKGSSAVWKQQLACSSPDELDPDPPVIQQPPLLATHLLPAPVARHISNVFSPRDVDADDDMDVPAVKMQVPPTLPANVCTGFLHDLAPVTAPRRATLSASTFSLPLQPPARVSKGDSAADSMRSDLSSSLTQPQPKHRNRRLSLVSTNFKFALSSQRPAEDRENKQPDVPDGKSTSRNDLLAESSEHADVMRQREAYFKAEAERLSRTTSSQAGQSLPDSNPRRFSAVAALFGRGPPNLPLPPDAAGPRQLRRLSQTFGAPVKHATLPARPPKQESDWHQHSQHTERVVLNQRRLSMNFLRSTSQNQPADNGCSHAFTGGTNINPRRLSLTSIVMAAHTLPLLEPNDRSKYSTQDSDNMPKAQLREREPASRRMSLSSRSSSAISSASRSSISSRLTDKIFQTSNDQLNSTEPPQQDLRSSIDQELPPQMQRRLSMGFLSSVSQRTTATAPLFSALPRGLKPGLPPAAPPAGSRPAVRRLAPSNDDQQHQANLPRDPKHTRVETSLPSQADHFQPMQLQHAPTTSTTLPHDAGNTLSPETTPARSHTKSAGNRNDHPPSTPTICHPMNSEGPTQHFQDILTGSAVRTRQKEGRLKELQELQEDRQRAFSVLSATLVKELCTPTKSDAVTFAQPPTSPTLNAMPYSSVRKD